MTTRISWILQPLFLQRKLPAATIHTATRIHDARTLIETEPITCIVSDYEMPDQNGLEFLRTVRETHPELPFILFTGKAQKKSPAKPSPGSDRLPTETRLRTVRPACHTHRSRSCPVPNGTRTARTSERNSLQFKRSAIYSPTVTASWQGNSSKSLRTFHSLSSSQKRQLLRSLSMRPSSPLRSTNHQFTNSQSKT